MPFPPPKTEWDQYVDSHYREILEGRVSLEDLATELSALGSASAEDIYDATTDRFDLLKRHLFEASMLSRRAKVPKTITYLVDIPDMQEFQREFMQDFKKELSLTNASYHLHSMNEDEGSIVYKVKVPYWQAKTLLENLRSLFTRKWEWDEYDWHIQKARTSKRSAFTATLVNVDHVKKFFARLQADRVADFAKPENLRSYLDQAVDTSDFSPWGLKVFYSQEFLGQLAETLKTKYDRTLPEMYDTAFTSLIQDLLENFEDALKGFGFDPDEVQEAVDEAANDKITTLSATLPTSAGYGIGTDLESFIPTAYGVSWADLVNEDKQEAHMEEFYYAVDANLEDLVDRELSHLTRDIWREGSLKKHARRYDDVVQEAIYEVVHRYLGEAMDDLFTSWFADDPSSEDAEAFDDLFISWTKFLVDALFETHESGASDFVYSSRRYSRKMNHYIEVMTQLLTRVAPVGANSQMIRRELEKMVSPNSPMITKALKVAADEAA